MRFIESLGFALALLVLQACGSVPQKTVPKGSSGQGQSTAVHAIDPAVQVRYQQALEWIRSKRYESAIETLTAITSQAPTLSGPRVNLGIAYAGLGHLQDAERAFRKALELNPENPVARNQLGILQRKQGKFDQARESYQGVLTAHPNYPYAHLNMGILCDLYLQNNDCALRHYERYLQLVESRDETVKLWVVDLKKRNQYK